MKQFVGIGWLMAGLLLLAGCGQENNSQAPAVAATHQPLQAAVIEVRTAQVPIRVEVTGQVTARYQATLASKIQGMIEEILVREGTVVTKGQTLVVLDRRDLDAELARAKAELENAESQRDRMVDLYQKDAVSKQELENATRTFKVAEATRNSILAQLSYTVVKAPFSGVIIEKKVEIGELASPGQPLLRMEDPHQLRLEATVAEKDMRVVSLGAQLPVVIDALGSVPLVGIVAQVVPAGDPQTHTFMIKVDLPRTSGLNSGMFGRLLLEKGVSETLVVPASAFIERGELSSVFVVGADNRAHLRWIKIGRKLDAGVEVLSGINPGERVLLDGAKGRDGAVVAETTAVARPPTRP
jgi:RND family efflux transporter MFP subunit